MARPRKQGMDYFPLDVDMFQDDKFVEIAVEHGNERTTYVIIRLLAELYRVGCCYRWAEKDQKIFAHKIGLKITEVKKIIDTCLEANFFNREVYRTTGFLTSKGIQRRFFYSVRGRKEVSIPEGVLLINGESYTDSININYIIVKNSIEHNTNVSNVETLHISNISNVETKKPKETNEIDKSGNKKRLINESDHVLLSEPQIESAKQNYLEDGLDLYDLKLGVQILDTYATNHPKKFKKYISHYLVLIGWVKDEVLKKKKIAMDAERSETYLKNSVSR